MRHLPGFATALGWSLCAALLPAGALALDFGPLERLGTAGHNLDMEFNAEGKGHLVYRRPRRQEVYYRHFDGTAWKEEQAVNDANSPATARKLDVNQPRICLAPDGGAWIAWARDRPTDKAYLRQISPTGEVLPNVLAVTLPANVEDLHVLARPGETNLHLLALMVDGETRGLATGTYDVEVDPAGGEAVSLEPLAVDGLGSVLQKNLDAALGAGPDYLLHETGRFHRAYYGQNGGTGWTMQIVHVENGLGGDLGATQISISTDDDVHLASESYDADTGTRELQYTRFHPLSGVLSEPVELDAGFRSFYGVPAIEATSAERVLVVWDREDPAEVPRLRYAFRDSSTGATLAGPYTLPLSRPDAAAEHPATAASGQAVHLVFNDPFDESLYAAVADFDLPSQPTPTPVTTATPTEPPSPTATSTPQIVEPGQPRISVQVVEVSDAELRIDYRVQGEPPLGCTVELRLGMPDGSEYGVLALAPELRRLRILQPTGGAWALEVRASDSCTPQSYFLDHSSAPLASIPWPAAWLALLLLGTCGPRGLRRWRGGRFPGACGSKLPRVQV